MNRISAGDIFMFCVCGLIALTIASFAFGYIVEGLRTGRGVGSIVDVLKSPVMIVLWMIASVPLGIVAGVVTIIMMMYTAAIVMVAVLRRFVEAVNALMQ